MKVRELMEQLAKVDSELEVFLVNMASGASHDTYWASPELVGDHYEVGPLIEEEGKNVFTISCER